MHPLETRDVTAASIIRECTARDKGIETNLGKAIWLDTPMIELIHGEGTIEKRIPAMLRMFGKYGIDIRKEPILVYPTLHYQNGGLNISVDCSTDVSNLYAAGEVAGGIHGRNRLMGNSLLDVIVFGRTADGLSRLDNNLLSSVYIFIGKVYGMSTSNEVEKLVEGKKKS